MLQDSQLFISTAMDANRVNGLYTYVSGSSNSSRGVDSHSSIGGNKSSNYPVSYSDFASDNGGCFLIMLTSTFHLNTLHFASESTVLHRVLFLCFLNNVNTNERYYPLPGPLFLMDIASAINLLSSSCQQISHHT